MPLGGAKRLNPVSQQSANSPERRGRLGLLRRAGLVVLVAVILLLVLWQGQGPLATWDAGRRAYPTLSGSLEVVGASAPISIHRDDRGVPHVRAQSEADAWFGLGFVHAQDRLGQMLWLRRLARGTTSELRGAEWLPVDRLVRTLGIGRSADTDAAKLGRDSASALFAYTDGINARLARLGAANVRALLDAPPGSPVESPWVPADSLALIKLLNWTMGPSLDAATVFAELVETLGGVGARPLLPTGGGMQGIGIAFDLPHGKPPSRLRYSTQEREPSELDRARSLLAGTVLNIAAWVVPGEDSQSGSPLLAAEFHLAPTVPVMVYEAHLSAAGFDVIGATVPGLPVYWAGRNGDVSWALTPSRVNTLQLYHETLRGEGEHREYQTGRRWMPMHSREEVIDVRSMSGEISQETLRVESTGHGPLLNGLIPDAAVPISLEWAASGRGDGLRALVGLVRAKDAEGILATLGEHHEPVLAVAYADRAGAAGWHVAGWVPRRLLGSAHLPAPGRQQGFDWERRVAFNSLPHSVEADRASHWIITADNPLLDETANRRIEWNWRNGQRGRRIERALNRLRGKGAIDLRELAEMQTRLTSQLRPKVMQAIEVLLATGPTLSPEAGEMWSHLQAWDGRYVIDRTGAAVYSVFLQNLTKQLLGSKLPEDLVDRYLSLAWIEPRVLVEGALVDAAKKGRHGGWSDPVLLSGLLGDSLHQAWVQLSYARGPNRQRWTWAGLHPLVFRPFVGFSTKNDGAQRWSFGGDEPFPGKGGGVSLADYDPMQPYAARSASLYRIAVDLAADDRILTSLAPGQSEHVGHRHERDGLGAWLSGSPRLIARTPFLVEENTVDLLQLEPPK
jgi:penicillin amidase